MNRDSSYLCGRWKNLTDSLAANLFFTFQEQMNERRAIPLGFKRDTFLNYYLQGRILDSRVGAILSVFCHNFYAAQKIFFKNITKLQKRRIHVNFLQSIKSDLLFSPMLIGAFPYFQNKTKYIKSQWLYSFFKYMLF